MRHPQFLELWHRPLFSPTYFEDGINGSTVWDTPFNKTFNVPLSAGPKKLAQVNSRNGTWIYDSCITPNGTFLSMADEEGVRVLKLDDKLNRCLEAEKLKSVRPETLIQKFWEEKPGDGEDGELGDEEWDNTEDNNNNQVPRQVTAMTTTNAYLYYSQNEFILKRFNYRRKCCELIAKRSW